MNTKAAIWLGMWACAMLVVTHALPVAAATGNVSGLSALMLCIGLLAAWCLATRQYIGGTLLLLLLGMMLLLFSICSGFAALSH